MSPEEKAHAFAVAKVGADANYIYWRSQLEEAWLAGHKDFCTSVLKLADHAPIGVAFRAVEETFHVKAGETVEIEPELEFEL